MSPDVYTPFRARMDLSAGDPVTGPVKAGDLLWVPTHDRIANANITAYLAWLKETRGLAFAGYPDLWEWSVTETEAFWQTIWDYHDIIAAEQPTAVFGEREMPGVEWFPGAMLNYAENVMAREAPGEVALYYHSETVPVTPLLWDDLAGKVRILATQLRASASSRATASPRRCRTSPRPSSPCSRSRRSGRSGRASPPTSAGAASSTGSVSSSRPC